MDEQKAYVVVLELEVRDGTHPRKWNWDDLIDISGEDAIVKRVLVLEREEKQT